MVPIKVKNEVDPPTATNDGLYVENSVENSGWYTVEDNHISMISEDVERVIKIETDYYDDCMWESRIDIAKDASDKFNRENKICCNICNKNFALDLDLKNHMKDHKKQTQVNSDIDLNHDNTVCQNQNICSNISQERSALDLDLNNYMDEHIQQTQNKSDNDIDLNNENTYLKKTGCSEENFVLNLDLNNCIEKHKKQIQNESDNNIDLINENTCLKKTNCSKENFVLNLDLNNCIEKHKKQTQNESDNDIDLNNENTYLNKTDCSEENFALDLDLNNYIEEHKNQTQIESDNDIDLNNENTYLNKKDCSENNFALHLDLNNHIEEHKKQTQVNTDLFKCTYCSKEFKLNFGLNRHIKKYHSQNNSNIVDMWECSICNNLVNESVFEEHMKIHENSCTEKDTDFVLNLKLCKLNGVWKSKPNFVFKCNICVEKFQNEINLLDHMKMHKRNDSQPQCEDSIQSISDNESQQPNVTNILECQKCNLKFDQKSNLDLHVMYCTKSSRIIWSKFLGKPNNEKNSFSCTVCGVGFYNSLSLKNHTNSNSGCNKQNNTFSENNSGNKYLCSKNMDEKHTENVKLTNINETHSNETAYKSVVESNCNKKYKIDIQCTKLKKIRFDAKDNTVNKNKLTHINTVPRDSTVNDVNDCSLRFKEVINSCSNVTENSHSNHLNVVNNSRSTVQNLMMFNQRSNIKKGRFVRINVKGNNSLRSSNDVETLDEIDETLLRCNQHNSMVKEYNLKLKKENNTCTTVEEINNSNLKNSFGTNNLNKQTTQEIIPQNIIEKNCTLNIKKEKGLESIVSNHMDEADSQESYLDEANNSEYMNETHNQEMTLPNKCIVKQEPEDSDNDSVAFNEKEPMYFSIIQSPNINSKQTLHNNCIYICNVCKISYQDIHSLALHMAKHIEACSMHECIVCSAKFDTIYLWTQHMHYHQSQVDTSLSELGVSSKNIKSNIHFKGTNISENMNSQCFLTTSKPENNSNIKCEFKKLCTNTIQTTINDSKKSNYNSSTTAVPLTLDSLETSKLFSCKYCSRKFTGQGQLTNHIRSHTNPNKNKLLLNKINDVKNTILNSNETQQCDMEALNSNVNLIPIPPKTKKVKRMLSLTTKRLICEYCKKGFAKQCYLTNHIKLAHKVNPKYLISMINPKKIIGLTSVNNEFCNINEQSTNITQIVKSINENTDNSLIPESNNVNISLNKKTVNKSSYCTICHKQFAHCGALTSHMHVHSNHRPYTCRYCNRKFSMKGPYTLHERNHKYKTQMKTVEIPNLTKVKLEANEEELQNIENFNGSESIDVALDNNPTCTSSVKKNRMWFICDVCEKKFSTPFQLISHRKSHNDSGPYVCTICDKSYAVRHRWNRHLKCHYNMGNNGIGISKNNNSQQQRKLKIDSIQPQNKFKCGYCKKEYNLIYHWKKHLAFSKICRRHCKRNLPEFTSNHAKELYTKSIRFECHICKNTYSTAYNRKVHLINVHNLSDTTNFNTDDNANLKKNKPVEIDTIQQNPDNINKKRRRKSPEDSGFRCNLCGKSYSNNANLGRHIKTIHARANGCTTCNICGRTFKHKYSYREHYRQKHETILLQNNDGVNTNKNINENVITTNKVLLKYSCQICKMKFVDNITLQKHTKTKHTVKYKCHDCGLQFDTNIILGEHIFENHTTIDGVSNEIKNNVIQDIPLQQNYDNPIKCHMCFKEFSSSSYLNEHMRLHSGAKPFKCDTCNIAFRFKSNLRAHKRKH